MATGFDMKHLSVREILTLWAGALRELYDRGIVRTFNSPIGDIAEELVKIHFDGERGPFSQKAWDVKTPAGELLQVKAIRRTRPGALGNLSPIHSDDGYDGLVVVIFAEDLTIEKAISVPRAVVNELFGHDEHVNGRIVRLTRAFLEHPEVQTVELSDGHLDG